MLSLKILLEPYHETKVVVRTSPNEVNTFYVKNSDPLVERFGIFVVKGLVEFKDQLAVLVLANLTDKSINLPAGTIVANHDIFSDDEWDTHEPNEN